MHIPDNYLSVSTCAVMTAAMIPVWKTSVKKVKEDVPKKEMPFLGLCSAVSFLSMMFNIPLPGGTTGHAVGAVLIAVLLGPYSACLSVSAALIVQAIFFGDGGVLAFGANAFNMAFIMPFGGYMFFHFIKKYIKNRSICVGIASYIGINLAAFTAAIEMGLQPLLFKDSAGNPLYCPYPLSVSVPGMMIGHLTLFGLAEVLFSVSVYLFIKKVSPNILLNEESKINYKPFGIFLTILIMLTPLGLIAEGTAWGEWSTKEIKSLLGYVPKGIKKGFNFNSIFPDYSINGMNNIIGYICAAVIGTILLILLFKIISMILKSRRHVNE